MLQNDRIGYLFQRYLDRTESPDELNELLDLIESTDQKNNIEQLLNEARVRVDRSIHLTEEQTERLFEAVRQQSGITPTPPMVPARRKWRIPTVIALGVAVGVIGYFAFFNNLPADEMLVHPVAHDVEAPQKSRATITLADGRTIALDSLHTLSQDKVEVRKTPDGRIVYSGNAGSMVYNTLTNPRGSQVIDITLADGSKVWLNAGSTITYPVAFVGNERKVTINGEAYFEVAHDKTRPFFVSKGAMQVEVLGTHFNVNAYDNEASTKVTLLEGTVKVVKRETANGKRHTEALLKPGEQAVVAESNSPLTIDHSPDLDEAMAWKNGRFEFNETGIQTVMKQIERWYDVQVVFDGAFDQHFNGAIQRRENVSKVLNMLEKTGGLRFAIDGKKVTVKKY